MAEENDLEIESGGKSKKMLFIIIAVVVLVVGGIGAFFMMSGDDAPEVEETLAEESTEAAQNEVKSADSAEIGTALYVGMPRPFVFNVPGAGRDRLVQIKVQLLVRSDANEEAAKKHIPLIEGTLLSIFSTANADALSTSAGKKALRDKSLQEVQKALTEIEGNQIVERVLFTGFVMQ
ncbi:flagellar basal body-associated protein FliL [Pseudoalteromonas denitrificans]|uniref:Flagellar protein FliL n=1 Tax=Pseudoalteromonas denitrificans DSM 6059 TaxID=1123010 RepID=A0A1I1HI48_9GAMM|nr:flagellar basal body-associated protein FliL [Pseudoalteromonas denitrificans]SFC23521.1 flagellar FliL protein [Pseudoalteromonas denitrificans DSM 6059]